MRSVVWAAGLCLALVVWLGLRQQPSQPVPLAPEAAQREPEATAPLVEPTLLPEGEAAHWPPEEWAPPAEGTELPPLPEADAVMALLTSQMERAFQEGLLDANEEWLPSRESLGYWIHWQLDQIAALSPERAAAYLGEDDPDYALLVAQRPGTLAELFSWPTEEDIDRLWENEETRRIFEAALHAKHYEDIAGEAHGVRWRQLKARAPSQEAYLRAYASDPLIPRLLDLRRHLESTEIEWWEELWLADANVYPHWSMLMRVAQRHFQ